MFAPHQSQKPLTCVRAGYCFYFQLLNLYTVEFSVAFSKYYCLVVSSTLRLGTIIFICLVEDQLLARTVFHTLIHYLFLFVYQYIRDICNTVRKQKNQKIALYLNGTTDKTPISQKTVSDHREFTSSKRRIRLTNY